MMVTKIDPKVVEFKKEVPLTIYFVRHGQAGKDEGDKEHGPVLTSLGERQAERVGHRLFAEAFNHMYSSDLSRAMQTAQAIMAYQKQLPWTVTVDLREVSYYHFAPGRTTLSLAMRKNVREERHALEHFITSVRLTHKPGEKLLVVCHGNVIRTILPIFGHRRPEKSIIMDIANTAVTILDVWPSGEAVLKLANCVKHLIPKQVT